MTVAVVLALALFAPAPAAIDLDLDALEPIEPAVRAELARAIIAATAEHASAAIHVEVRWQDHAELAYAVMITIDADEAAGAVQRSASTDPDATVAGLAELVAAALERALAERPSAVAPAPERAEPEPAPSPNLPPARRRALGPVGWAGVGVAIAGAGGLAAGIGLLATGRTADPHDATRLLDWRYAGGALAGLGLAAIIGGTAMAIVDAHGRPRRTTVAPWTGRHRGGVAFFIAF